MCWSREFIKVFHIKNANTNTKICDIELVIVNNHSLWIDNTAGNLTNMSCRVNGVLAKQEGEMGTNCCGCAYNIIHENMGVHILYDSIPELFTKHKVEWVLDLGPVFDKPFTRMHLYIDDKNVMDANNVIDTMTNKDYRCSKCCIKFMVFMTMALIFGCLYALIGMAFLGSLSWAFLAFWMLFGAATWHHILACTAKAVCDCSDPGQPTQVDVLFDPNSCSIETVELVVNNQNGSNHNAVYGNAGNSNSEDVSLPPGWTQVFTNDGKVYYQNDITKQTQWEKPVIVPQSEPQQQVQQQIVIQQNLHQQPSQQQQSLPDGWRQVYANNGKIYYQNDITKKTQWEMPTH